MIPEKQALAVFWSHKRFFLLQALALALWAALAVSWFWLPDSQAWGVALSAVDGFVVLFAALWLTAAALLFYRRAHDGADTSLRPICRESMRRLPALLGWALIFGVALWASLRPKAPPWIWLLPAILLLPLAAQVIAEGWRGLFRLVWRPRYFPAAILLAAIGAFIPYKLIGWRPPLTGIGLQTASLAVRFAVAYFLAVISWLILASLIARLGRR